MTMAATRQFEGETIEAALEAASAALGVPADEVEYRVLDEGRRGVFGLGARPARIEVQLADDAGQAPQSEAALAVATTVSRMVELMGLELQVRASPASHGVRVTLGGRDRKALQQRDGQLLSALQFVLNRMARRAWPGAGRIQVQCEGQQPRNRRRDEALVAQVRRLATEVIRSGQPRALEDLNPYERRIVHVTARQFAGVVTRSEGEGFRKRVVIAKDAEAD